MGKGFQGAVLKALGAHHHLATATAVTDLAGGFRRVTFEAPDLLAGREPHPTMWIRMWFPHDGKEAQRAYTLVDPDPAAGTFGIDFALHDVDGPATRWARTVETGDAVEATVFGSRFSVPEVPPKGYLLIGDPAALPAINSILGGLDSGIRVKVWLESGHDTDTEAFVAVTPSTTVTWVPREPGGSALPGLVEREVFDASGWFAWVSSETKATRAVKSLLRKHYGLGAVAGQAYWIAGRAMGTERS